MALRFTKEAARTESPRAKDTPHLRAAPVRSANHGSDGRFVKGNRAGDAQAFKAMIRRGLGDPDHPETQQLVRDALSLYRAVLRSLPSAGPGVRPLVAAQARHTTLAAHYANAAAAAGLATPEGLKLAEASRAHDGTAQRLAVTAYDRAVREANQDGRAKRNPIMDHILAAGTET